MSSIEGFDFFPLHFDKNGVLQGALDELQQRAGAATDVIFIAHGFRNSEDDATGLYTKFLHNFQANLGRPELKALAQRNYAVAGVYWPSLAFQETFQQPSGGGVQAFGDDSSAQQQATVEQQIEDLKAEVGPEERGKLDQAKQLLAALDSDSDAQDRFVSLVLSVLGESDLGAGEGVEEVRAQEGTKVLGKLRLPIIVSTQQAAGTADAVGSVAGVGSTFASTFATGGDSSAEGGTQGLGSFFGSVLGAAGRFLNFTTWWVMKERSGVVGANGVAQAVRDLKSKHAGLKVHLVGHSLGGRLMASCAKSLCANPPLQPDSVTLLEAAFSHYGFSADAGLSDDPAKNVGFFRDVITAKICKGPLVATFSAMDTVVGHVYALASRVAGDNVKAVGDANDPFGGIGRNGAQKTQESITAELHDVGDPYKYQIGVVNNLDGSNHLIVDHSDVTNERVTYAFASSVAAT
ncbi:MAG TPA: hypothetical protein VIY49_03435 [Bryobacteraceae bacterium]